MRYQFTAIGIGILTLIAVTAVAFFIHFSIAADDDARRQTAVEAEFATVEAALYSRIESLRAHAAALLQQQPVINYVIQGGNPPAVLNNGRITRGGAEYIVISGPGRRVVMQDGLTDSIVTGGNDSLEEALYLLDGAINGGVFDFREAPILAAGASTGPGTDRAAIALGIRLDSATLAAMTAATNRRISLTWGSDSSVPTSVQFLAGAASGRISIVGPVDLGQSTQRTLVAVIDAPESILPPAAGADLTRWFGILIVLALALAGLFGFGVVVRAMASSIGDVRTGLLAAAENDRSPAVLDSIDGRDEVGRTAAQASETLRTVRERTVAAIDEARVATARQLLGEHVIRSMHEAVFVERSDGTCIVYNPAATTLLGVQPAEVLGVRNGIRHVLGDDLYRRLQDRAQNPEPSQRLDVVSIQGTDLTFDAYRVPEYHSEGHSLLGIIRDVSAVLEVEQLKRDIVSVVSHELRTPLTVIALFTGMLNEPGADQSQLFAAIDRNVLRTRELVDDMLDLARLESGQADPQFEPHSPVDLVRDVIQLLAPQAHEKSITVREHMEGPIPATIEVDIRQMQRAITNLLSNAIKFSPAGTDVWVILTNSSSMSWTPARASHSQRSIASSPASTVPPTPASESPASVSASRSCARSPNSTAEPVTCSPPSEVPTSASPFRRNFQPFTRPSIYGIVRRPRSHHPPCARSSRSTA